jgi:metallophosphoesterase superfamily enzyme
VIRPAGWFAQLVQSGEYHRLAAQCTSDVELAERLGCTADAIQNARARLRRQGQAVPTVLEVRFGGAAVGLAEQPQDSTVTFAAASAWQDNSDADEFEFEPPTERLISLFREPQIEATQPNPTPSGSAIYRSAFDADVRHTKKLTRQDCPDGTLMLWASDIHIPIQNDPVCRLMVECAERSGVTRVIAGGDILDMNCLSLHAKESRRTVEHATILEEVEPGRWLLDWMATKQCDLILGNHEDRLKRFVDENPAFHGSVASNFAKVCELPSGINVLDGEVRLGNLSMFHGHAEFKNGTGGKYPAQKILDMFPDQSSICGHLHRKSTAYRTTRDEDSVPRTRRAWTMGHLSHEHMHYGYVGRSPNWQVGFGLIRVWWDDERPRWTVYPIEVLFDRYGRPTFEWEGKIYK